MPVNMPSTELVFFSMSVSMSVTVSTTLSVVVLVRVSGRIRVGDTTRYRCCSHVSVSGSDRDRCGVRAPWPSSIASVTKNVSIAVSLMSVTLWPVTLWSVTSDLVRDRVCVLVQCPWPFPYPCLCLGRIRVSAIVSVSVSMLLLMSVTVIQCPCSRDHVSDRVGVTIRDRVRVRGRVHYILSVSVVVPIMSSVIIASGLFWDIVTGLPWTSNGVALLLSWT